MSVVGGRDHASGYLSGDEPIIVRRRRRVPGFYLPVKRKRETEDFQ